jgi:hypothetical protein
VAGKIDYATLKGDEAGNVARAKLGKVVLYNQSKLVRSTMI